MAFSIFYIPIGKQLLIFWTIFFQVVSFSYVFDAYTKIYCYLIEMVTQFIDFWNLLFPFNNAL